MWHDALGSDAFAAATVGATVYHRGIMRLFGIPESEIAATLRMLEADGLELSALEITTCLRRGEIEIATRYEPAAAPLYERLVEGVRRRHADTLFSEDATAESCTAGLLAARLTDRPGASAYVLGGIVAYDDRAKVELADVDAGLLESHGAVSTEVAAALADGARTRLHAEIGVGITGIAGPDGGTPEKPVGLVCFSVSGPGEARMTRSTQLPGNRAAVRDRSVTVAMHLLRRVLLGETDRGQPQR
jgi:PncC family amidohydrolase